MSLLLFVLAVASARAQFDGASVLGTVRDASGALGGKSDADQLGFKLLW